MTASSDEIIKLWIRIYAIYGIGVFLIMFMRSLAIDWKMPVTGNLTAAALFSFLSVVLGGDMIFTIYHHAGVLKVLTLCSPMILLSLWGCYYTVKELVKLVPPKQNS